MTEKQEEFTRSSYLNSVKAAEGDCWALSFVTVVVPCYNEEKYIGMCLDSILGTDYPQDRLEILVVDGRSTDRTREIIQDYVAQCPKITLIDNPKRILAAAWNLGITNGRGEIIMALNAHAVFPPDYIPTCIKYLEAFPEADYVGGVIVSHSREKTLVGGAIAAALSSRFGVGWSDFRVGITAPKWADTAAFGGYRREVFSRVGLFDENLPKSQDMDFHIRMIKAGCKILLVPEMACHYFIRTRFLTFIKDYLRNGFWATYPLKINHKAIYWRHLVPLFFILSLFGSLLLSFINPSFYLILICIIISYLATNILFSVKTMLDKNDWRYLLVMPIIYTILHLIYGFGSLAGLSGPLSLIFSPKKRADLQ